MDRCSAALRAESFWLSVGHKEVTSAMFASPVTARLSLALENIGRALPKAPSFPHEERQPPPCEGAERNFYTIDSIFSIWISVPTKRKIAGQGGTNEYEQSKTN
jgi:hypothetical protein